MKIVIIAIHGLGNKPAAPVLHQWWMDAIGEGLRRINSPYRSVPLEMVYWSHFLHPVALDMNEMDDDSPHFIEDPYVPSNKRRKKEPSLFRQKVLDYVEKQLDKLMLREDFSINFSAISDMIIRNFFKDLDIYFKSNCVGGEDAGCMARDRIRRELYTALKKNRRKKILLIAHSMGSIIAYDVLKRHESELKLDTFITIGSPLGLPVLLQKLAREHSITFDDKLRLKTPDCIQKKWINLSDLNDRVAFNYNLSDDFSPNQKGIAPQDFIVFNDYEYKGKKNPHKSYGYLRTEELAKIVHGFLEAGTNPIIRWLRSIISWGRKSSA